MVRTKVRSRSVGMVESELSEVLGGPMRRTKTERGKSEKRRVNGLTTNFSF